MDESLVYDTSHLYSVSAIQHAQHQQTRQRFLYLREGADWANDQHKLPDTIASKNRALLKQYADSDRRLERANNVLLRVATKRSISTRVERTNDILLRVGIQRSMASMPQPLTSSTMHYSYFCWFICFTIISLHGIRY